jgi:hypothetical protein
MSAATNHPMITPPAVPVAAATHAKVSMNGSDTDSIVPNHEIARAVATDPMTPPAIAAMR